MAFASRLPSGRKVHSHRPLAFRASYMSTKKTTFVEAARPPSFGLTGIIRMEEFLNSLTQEYNLIVESPGEGWKIDLPSCGEFICQLDIGSRALDWYATVLDRNDRHKIWMDWMDYYGYDDKSEDQLVDDKERDISWFVRAWITATALRVSQESALWGLKKRTILYWYHSGTWDEVQLHDPAR